jgi:hypothetical protein
VDQFGTEGDDEGGGMNVPLTFHITRDSEGLFHWVLKARGQLVAKSPCGYVDKGNCKRTHKAYFPDVKIVDEALPRPIARTKEQRNYCPPV